MTRNALPVAGRVLLLLAIAVMIAPTLPTGTATSTAAHAAGTTVALSSSTHVALPAVLSASWAERSGFASVPVAAVAHPVTATGTVSLTVTLWPSSLGLFAPPAPGAPPLTASEVAQRFGPSVSTYDAIASYFASEGLVVTHTWPDRLSMGLTGPAGAVDAAFGTTLAVGDWHGHSVRFPQTVPQLPSSLASEVAAVSGLTDGFTQFTIPFSPQALPAPAAAPSAARTTQLVTPAAIHQIYDLNGLYNYSGTPHWSTGVGIALVLWGRGYSPSDIQGFYGSYYPSGFPSILVQAYPVDGAPAPSPSAVNDPSGAAQELTLDLEWSGSEAPGATLSAVYAPDGPASNNYSPSDPSMEDALSTAIGLAGVKVVSMSFGTPDGSDPSFQTAFAVSFASATQRGITVLAASGDNGGTSQPNCQGGTSPQFPAASPQVLAVGGTAPVVALDAIGNVVGLASEPAWNLSGGGFSTDYASPSWQDVGSAGAAIGPRGERGIPDVAGPAADNFFYFAGNPAAGKGTSFATPMWAGMLAEMDALRGSSFGFVTPRLYRVGASEATASAAQGLIDTVQGSTCLGPATTGWDTATGWGSPRGLLLYQDLLFSYVDVNLTTSSGEVVPGGSVDASVVVLNSTSHRPIPNLPVDFSLGALGSIGVCSGMLATGTVTTNSTGGASISLSVPGCYLGSRIGLTAAVSSQGYFGSNVTALFVNLLGLATFLSVIQVYPYNVIAFVVIMGTATAIGVSVGSWRHERLLARQARQRAATRPPRPPSREPGGMGPPGGEGPPPEPPPLPPGPSATPSEPPPIGPVTVPPHVAEPSGALPPHPDAVHDGVPGGAPVPSHVAFTPSRPEPPAWEGDAPASVALGSECLVCGATLVPGSDRCPRCGTSVRHLEEPDERSAEVHEPGPGG